MPLSKTVNLDKSARVVSRYPNGEDDFPLLNTSIVFPISGIFCKNFMISKTQNEFKGMSAQSSDWTVSVHVLPEVPLLFDECNFMIREKLNFNTPTMLYENSFYLHKGSKYSISSCVVGAPSPANVCIVSGDREYNSWLHTRKCPHSIPLSVCSPYPSIIHYGVADRDDKYYFIHYIDAATIGSEVFVQNWMSFWTEVIHIIGSNVHAVTSCTIPNSKPYNCSTDDLSVTFRGVAVLTVTAAGTSSNVVDYYNSILIKWSCDPEESALIIMLLLPCFIITSICGVFVLLS